MDIEKKFISHRFGPGGLTCPCCGPAPGKHRREFVRMAKHAAKPMLRKDIEDQLNCLEE